MQHPLFEDFGSADAPIGTRSEATVDAIEDEKLAAFENGYQAGWDDAVKAQSQTQTTVSSALAANLQEASFQYHEMRASLHKTVQEIMEAVVTALLPDMARQSLGAHVCEEVSKLARDGMDATVQVVVHPSNLDRVEALTAQMDVQSHDVAADDTLAPDAALIQIAGTEHVVDLARVMEEVRTAISEFFETQLVEGNDDGSS